ncbi:MAG: DUF1353 domain-containing protein [Opitutaceae bacterium]|jgi:hypothetical protein|nr:DUF1353 domain-containing protein [Opitutaceae bacterium]
MIQYIFAWGSSLSLVGTGLLVAFRIVYNRVSARNPVWVDPVMFPDPLLLEPIDSREDYFRVLDHYRVKSGVRGNAWVEPGFDTDFLSIPWFARAYLSPNSRYRRAAVQHDRDYWFQDVRRGVADRAFREEMESLDSRVAHVRRWDRAVLRSARWLIFHALRAGGWWAWRGNGRARRREESGQ